MARKTEPQRGSAVATSSDDAPGALAGGPRPRRSRSAARRVASALTVTVAAAAALSVLAAIVVAIDERAGTAAATATGGEVRPLEVTTVRLPPPAPHTVEEGYVGRIEAARASNLAFERGGLVVEVLADEGDDVAVGDTLARLDTRDLEARRRELDARRASNEANRELAMLTLERTRRLAERGHASPQALDEDRLAHQRLVAATDEIEAGLERVSIALDKSVLRAPFAGRIAARHVDEGMVIDAGTPVLELLETTRPQLRVGLPETRAGDLAAGDTVTVLYRGQRTEGTVQAVRPDMDPSTQTVVAIVDLPLMDEASVGAVARLLLPRTLSGEGWTLPLAALKEGERGLWTVLTVREADDDAPGAAKTAGLETVEVLAVTGGTAFVRGTLEEGMEVIVEGRHRVVRGDPVAPTQAPDTLRLAGAAPVATR